MFKHKRKGALDMRDRGCKKPECQNHRMGTFVRGMSLLRKAQPNNHVPNQRKTRKVVV